MPNTEISLAFTDLSLARFGYNLLKKWSFFSPFLFSACQRFEAKDLKKSQQKESFGWALDLMEKKVPKMWITSARIFHRRTWLLLTLTSTSLSYSTLLNFRPFLLKIIAHYKFGGHFNRKKCRKFSWIQFDLHEADYVCTIFLTTVPIMFRLKLLFISYKFVKGFLAITFLLYLLFLAETFMMCFNVFFYINRNEFSVWYDKKMRIFPIDPQC